MISVIMIWIFLLCAIDGFFDCGGNLIAKNAPQKCYFLFFSLQVLWDVGLMSGKTRMYGTPCTAQGA